jgi:1-acyl-sn-glycerol-3-phosphate acyltransferase
MRSAHAKPVGLFEQPVYISVSATALPRVLLRGSYGVYAWLALVICGAPALLMVTVTPGRELRRRLTRWFARVFFYSIGSPIGVAGEHHMPQQACVVVANHASYLDGIILTAALPPNFTFVIKREMSRFPLAGFLLRRIGSEFVDRADDAHRKQMTRRLFKAARSGDALAFFPEGTFRAEPGLRSFKSGAFRAAWKNRLPVVPVVIRGARRKLPAEVWLPSPGPLDIHICEPLVSDAHDSAQGLMLAARRALLEKLDEPDLG